MMLSIFLRAYWTFIYLLWRITISFAYFKLVIFSYWVGRAIYILDIKQLSDIWFENIFFNSVSCLFTFLIGSFDSQNFKILIKSNLSIYSFFVFSVLCLRNCCLTEDHEDLQVFPSKSFIVLILIFKSLIHFELIFIGSVR